LKEWKEGQGRTINMPETDDEAFNIWTKWLYTGRVYLTKEGDRSKEGYVLTNREWIRWSACYALSDFLQDPNFADACIDASIEFMRTFNRCPSNLALWIYNSTQKTSAHRKLAIDAFINCWNREHWKDEINHPPGFLSDTVKQISPRLQRGLPTQTPNVFFDANDTCKYHDHGPEKPCYKTKPAFRF
jgi:hypothetical protein